MKKEPNKGPAVSGEGFRTGCGGFATIIVGKRRVKAENAATAILHFLPLLLAAQQYLKARDHYDAIDAPSGKRLDAMVGARDRLRAVIGSVK